MKILRWSNIGSPSEAIRVLRALVFCCTSGAVIVEVSVPEWKRRTSLYWYGGTACLKWVDVLTSDAITVINWVVCLIFG